MVPPTRVTAGLTLVLAAAVLGVPSAARGAPPAPAASVGLADSGNGTWQPLGPGLNSAVFDMVIAPDDTLYIAGGFNSDGSQTLKNIAA